MITFLQEKLQKHYKWLLGTLLLAISLSFIFAYSSYSGRGKGQPKFKFYNFNLYEPKTQKRIFEGAGLSLYFHTGQTLKNEKDLQDLGFTRASLLHLADTLHIPAPEEEALKSFIAALPLFQNQDGSFNSELYKEFQQEIESKLGGDLAYQILVDDYRIQDIENILRGPSYVQDLEVENYLNQFYSMWSVCISKLNIDSLQEKNQKIPLNELENFYQSNLDTYRSSPTISVTYVCMEEVDPDTAEQKAHDLLYALYEDNIDYNTDAFHKALKDKQLSILKLESFPLNKVPEDGIFPKHILEEIFSLDESTYYTSPLRVGERVYVLFLDGVFPPEQLSFEAVREQVAKDYQAEKNKSAFTAKTQALAAQLETIHSPEAFKTKAESLGLEYKEFSNFKLSNPPPDLGLNVASQVHKLKEGEVSSTLFQDKDAIWVYVDKKINPSLTKDSPDWQLAFQQIEALVTFSRLQSILAEWVSSGLPKNQ